MRSIALAPIFDYRARSALAALEVEFRDDALRDPDVQTQYAYVCRDVVPTFGDMVDQAREALARDGYVRLSGAPLDAANVLLAGISAALGSLAEPYRAHWSNVIRHIRPNEAKRPLVGGRVVVLNEVLHTDGTDWPIPNDYTCLLCVRPDPLGHGRSRVLGMVQALDHLLSLKDAREAVTELWEKPLRWRIAEEIGGGVHIDPALSPAGFRWLEYALCTDDENLPLVRIVADTLEQAAGIEEDLLAAGELLIIDNHAALHARSALPDASSSRLFLRTKVRATADQPRSVMTTEATQAMRQCIA